MLPFIALVCFYKFGDSMVSSLIGPFLRDTGLTKESIAIMKGTVGSLASLAGAGLGGWMAYRAGRRGTLFACGVMQSLSLLLYVAAAAGLGGVGLLWVATVTEHLLGSMATVALFTLMMDASDPEHAGTDYTLLACAVVVRDGARELRGRGDRRCGGLCREFHARASSCRSQGASCWCAALDRRAGSGTHAAGLDCGLTASPHDRGIFAYAARAAVEVRMQDLRQYVIDIPDFPKPGILFRDISPLLRRHFGATIEAIEGLFSEDEWQSVDAVAGIESRGFILASALAERRDKGFVPIRKKGKLPPPVVDIAYDLEYGTGVLEMQAGQGRLLLIDDVLATGGTLTASVALSRQAGYSIQGVGVLIDIGIAPGFRCNDHEPRVVLQYG